tara:strand:+ start:939 stop:1118 length:180 start_codon:yes stop_codon:yes gene_type:complete
LGKIARNKLRVWLWSKFLKTLGAITVVCKKIIPHIIPEIIVCKSASIVDIKHKTKYNPK